MTDRLNENDYLIRVLREAIKVEHHRDPYNRQLWADLNSFLDSCEVIFD